jgi:hypothetical protein
MKEKINLISEQLQDLWDGIYHKGNKYSMLGEEWEQITRINTSEFSDGESWDYIIKRISDNKLFMFNVWDAGYNNGYIFEDKFLIEVNEHNTVSYK